MSSTSFDTEALAAICTTLMSYMIKLYLSFYVVFPLVSVNQERKLWKHPLPKLSLWGMLKVYLFNVVWFVSCQLGAIFLLPKFLLGMNVELGANKTEVFSSYSVISCFIGPVVLKGKENLPPVSKSDATQACPSTCVFVANHASQIDAGVVYYIRRRFKWIAKKSIIYLPGVGQIMYMGNHIFINRSKGSNRVNIKNMYREAKVALTTGISMFVFPQGTRRMVERLPFKDGAFNMAIETEVPIIPISIEIPLTNVWNTSYPLNLLWKKRENLDKIILTVHKPVSVSKDSDKEKLKERCFNTIYSVLPDIADCKKD
mmetsp:Transcript_12056/g.17459  ORF Transcript_12056/g.17459 Transcript_12056/m.17459 type:complete len:315 (+) Transcript_12056:117-1061(+)